MREMGPPTGQSQGQRQREGRQQELEWPQRQPPRERVDGRLEVPRAATRGTSSSPNSFPTRKWSAVERNSASPQCGVPQTKRHESLHASDSLNTPELLAPQQSPRSPYSYAFNKNVKYLYSTLVHLNLKILKTALISR